MAGRGRRCADRIHRSPPGQTAATSRSRCRRFRRQRADGLFAYQLAVVVDDGLRGSPMGPRRRSARLDAAADLAAASARIRTPAYLHHPIAIDRSGGCQRNRRAQLPDDPLPALCAHGGFSGQAAPEHRRHRWQRSGAWRMAPGMRARCLRWRCCRPMPTRQANRSLDGALGEPPPGPQGSPRYNRAMRGSLFGGVAPAVRS